MKNKKAKYLLKDLDFSQDGAHLAYTLMEFGGNNIQDNTPILLKGQEVNLTPEQKNKIEDIRKELKEPAEPDLNKAKTKAEGDGSSYSASDYAYVPDPDKPSTWKLNISDARHVAAAAAAFSEGGFRGNKVSIPADKMEAVKAKVRAAHKKFFPKQDMPASISKAADNNSNKDIGDIMPEDNQNLELADIKKQLSSLQDIVKAQTARADKAEAEAKAARDESEKVQKALKEERIQKAKNGLKDIVKSWANIKDDQVDAMVENLYKAEDPAALMTYVSDLSKAYTDLKKSMGVEQGEDGDVPQTTPDDEEIARVEKALMQAGALQNQAK